MVSPFVKQSRTIIAVLLSAIGQGVVLSYPHSLLPALRADDSPIKINLETASWIASCPGITMLLALLVTSVTLDRCGRQRSHIYFLLPGTLGWILIYFSTNTPMLICARLLTGLSNSSTYVIGCVVIGEYTSPEHRGLFMNLKATFLCVGNLVVHTLGIFFHWRTLALITATILILSLCISCTWNESPAWLLYNNRLEESEKIFYSLRGVDDKSVKEFESMVRAQTQRNALPQTKTTLIGKLYIFIQKFRKNDFTKPVIIMSIGFILLEASGRHIFPAYAFDIMSDFTVDKTQALWFTLAIDVMAIASSSFACILIKAMNRRKILFHTGIISLILLWTISLYQYLLSNGILLSMNQWILPSMLVIYFLFANLGCIAVPLIIFGELFPLPHRAIASTLTTAVSAIMVTLALKISPAMFATLKVYGTFLVLSVVMLLSLLYLYFILPETKNRTLQEIEDYFNHGRFLNEDKDGQKSKTSLSKEESEVLLDKMHNIDIELVTAQKK